jgi:hypothetical protein
VDRPEIVNDAVRDVLKRATISASS